MAQTPFSPSRPRLCLVGPMIGRAPGYVTTQGLIKTDLFREAGYSVISASSSVNRYVRLLDIIWTLITKRNSFDLMMLEVYGGRSFVVEDVASRIGRLFKKRMVMVLHGGAMPEFMARFPAWTLRVLKRADLLVAPSPYLARAVEPYGFQAQVIPNIIDLAVYPYRQRGQLAPRLFWMRSFHPDWNPEMAVHVLARLRQAVPDATLVMAGQDKGLQAPTVELARKLGLDGAVRFPGFLNMPAKIREGEAADIFINTNHVDNMPVALVEAGAMGLPVVSTAVGGVPDLITHGESGLLVPDDDIGAMAEAICRLLKDPELAAKLSAGGRQVAERSAWEQVLPLWERVFCEVLSRSRRAMENL